jgi:hypothetical protein
LVPGGLFTLRSGTVEIRLHTPVPTLGHVQEQGATLAAMVREIVERGCAET